MVMAMTLSVSGCVDEDEDSTAALSPGTITHFQAEDSAINVQIVSITFDEDNYKAGDKVTATLEVKNTGTDDITSEKIDITARLVKLKSTTANLALKTLSDDKKKRSYSKTYKELIIPGDTKNLSAVFTTQAELEGISLAGEYDIYIKLYVNDVNVGSSNLVLRLD